MLCEAAPAGSGTSGTSGRLAAAAGSRGRFAGDGTGSRPALRCIQVLVDYVDAVLLQPPRNQRLALRHLRQRPRQAATAALGCCYS